MSIFFLKESMDLSLNNILDSFIIHVLESVTSGSGSWGSGFLEAVEKSEILNV